MAKKNTESPSRTPTRRRAAGAVAPPSVAANGERRGTPTHDEIAEAAYRRYLSRGGGHGQDFDDWLEAERELQRQNSQ